MSVAIGLPEAPASPVSFPSARALLTEKMSPFVEPAGIDGESDNAENKNIKIKRAVVNFFIRISVRRNGFPSAF